MEEYDNSVAGAKKRKMKFKTGDVAKVKIMYTEEQRIQAVKMLRDNGFDYKATSRELGISTDTLRSWKCRYQNVIDLSPECVVAQKVELDLAMVKLNFVSENYRAMDELAKASIERALTLVKSEEDLGKVNGTIKIITDFMAKMNGVDEQKRPESGMTVNVIKESILQLNQINMQQKKEGE